MQSDDMPEWISAIGSLGAVVVALAIALREAALRRRALRDDERRLARLVVLGEPAADSPQIGRTRDSLFATLHNFGEFPVHDVWVTLTMSRGGMRAGPVLHSIDMLGPGESYEFEFAAPDGPGGLASNSPEVHFLDAFGRHWRRTSGQSEPTRVLNYIPVGLPPPIRLEIARALAARTARGRIKLWISRGRWQPPVD